MTATRLLKAATIITLLAVWVVAAGLLWRTRVPHHLGAPRLDPAAYFSRRELERSSAFERFLRLDWLAGTLAGLAALAALALFGRQIARRFPFGRIGAGIFTATFVAVALWIVGLPFGAAALWWQRRYRLEKQSYPDWLLAQSEGLAVKTAVLALAVAVLMLLAVRLPRRWWIPGSAFLVATGVVFMLVSSWLTTIGTHPIRDPQLGADVRALARREGVSATKVRIDDVSDGTRAVNAETVGVGRLTTVVLWDTLLQAHLSRNAIEFVAAHELGHAARRHILKGIAWSVLFTVPLTFLLAEATRRRGGLARPELVPFALLVGTALQLVALPLENVISRRYEAEADWLALRTTRQPAAGRQAFESFTKLDLAQPRSPLWSYVLLDDHPTTIQRIAMTKAWERRR